MRYFPLRRTCTERVGVRRESRKWMKACLFPGRCFPFSCRTIGADGSLDHLLVLTPGGLTRCQLLCRHSVLQWFEQCYRPFESRPVINRRFIKPSSGRIQKLDVLSKIRDWCHAHRQRSESLNHCTPLFVRFESKISAFLEGACNLQGPVRWNDANRNEKLKKLKNILKKLKS